jgi:hypothetical protein
VRISFQAFVISACSSIRKCHDRGGRLFFHVALGEKVKSTVSIVTPSRCWPFCLASTSPLHRSRSNCNSRSAEHGRNERERGRESYGRCDGDICSLVNGTEILESRAGSEPVLDAAVENARRSPVSMMLALKITGGSSPRATSFCQPLSVALLRISA